MIEKGGYKIKRKAGTGGSRETWGPRGVENATIFVIAPIGGIARKREKPVGKPGHDELRMKRSLTKTYGWVSISTTHTSASVRKRFSDLNY